MLALKKKREAEAAAAAATNVVAAPAGEEKSAAEVSNGGGSTTKVSLIGAIGGKKTKDKAAEAGKDGASAGKKRTPGEIRIQKGMYW